MHAAGADLLAAEVSDAVDAGVGPHHEFGRHGVERLPEIDPAVAARAMPVGRDVVAADELDLAARNLTMRVVLADLVVVVDVEAVLRPRPRFGDYVQQVEMG